MLAALFGSLSRERKRDLLIAGLVMLAGALAELLTIGSLLTFLELISGAAGGGDRPSFAWILDVTEGLSGNLVARATLLLVIAAILSAAARLFLLWTVQRLVLRLGHDLAAAIFSRMLRQPYSFYLSRNPSELFASVEKVQAVTYGAVQPLMQGVVAMVIGGAIICLLFVIDPVTALVSALAIGLIYLLVSAATRPRLIDNSKVMAGAATARMRAIQEALGSIRDILLGHTQRTFEESYRRLDYRLRARQASNVFITGAPRFIIEAAGIIVIGLVALFMSFQPGGLVEAVPVLGALALGAQRLLPLLQQAYSAWGSITGNTGGLLDIIALINAPIVDDEPPREEVGRLPFARDIAFDQVSLDYPERPHALRNVSFLIAKGSRVGIMGPSGSGKSSLLDVLMGLLQPSAGEIRIDGQPITAENRALWQRHVAHVPQTVYLPDASIAACIAFGEAEIDRERLESAARQAQLHDFIITLPKKYDTEVGERGVRLSGGQRQRIAIARALYKNASLLILDEATGALDQETEWNVMESIKGLSEEITMVVVSHRLSTLEGCDPIILLEAGAVAAQRRYEELARP